MKCRMRLETAKRKVNICTKCSAKASAKTKSTLFYTSTVGSRFATVRFMTIRFYVPCPVEPSTSDLWYITVVIQASFLYSVRFHFFSGVHVYLIFLFYCICFKLIVIFPPTTSVKKTEEKKKSEELTSHFLLTSSEPHPGPSSTK